MTEQRTALVTGASRGIGAAIADRLVADGYFVAGTATSDAGAQAISARLAGNGVGLRLNVADSESVSQCLAQVAEASGAPLVLVNNAGITKDNLLMRMTEAEWGDVIDTNLSGAFRVAKPVLRGMLKARWGRIVNVGSVVGRLGNPGQGNYVASKAGLEGFTRSLAMEVASRGVTVNAVAPGFIATDMTDELTQEQKDVMLDRIPLGRMGEAEEIAATVGFLCSDQASYITGQTLQVNGGLLFG
ncbi:MAG: 3-oxoacyl-ACP reductase FabG [Gammaproteobacteria bacterium]|jgi:3-oxoacyl-[acyl-carrier protein] reductase